MLWYCDAISWNIYVPMGLKGIYQVKKFEARALNTIKALTKNFEQTNLTQPHPPKLGLIIKPSKKDL